MCGILRMTMTFQSTLPGRGATMVSPITAAWSAFQSTLPGRGATSNHADVMHWFPFQSTLPGRGATLNIINYIPFGKLSIHAPRAGSDFDASRVFIGGTVFQSTLPGRGATTK